MSSSHVRDFLSWFEGFADNIEGDVLTQKQWERLRSKLYTLKTIVDAEPIEPDAARPVYSQPGVDANPAGSHTTEWWKNEVRKVLADIYDGEDLPKMVAKIPVNLNVMPEDAVKRFLANSGGA
jgi:hypothetical protein